MSDIVALTTQIPKVAFETFPYSISKLVILAYRPKLSGCGISYLGIQFLQGKQVTLTKK